MSWFDPCVGISELVGKTLTSVAEDKAHTELLFVVDDGTIYKMYHEQDCCESVYIEDICGELSWLEGTPILDAYESSNKGNPKTQKYGDYTFTDESSTWTFYTIRTMKGTVTIRWYGTSNGYYSESVCFVKVIARRES